MSPHQLRSFCVGEQLEFPGLERKKGKPNTEPSLATLNELLTRLGDLEYRIRCGHELTPLELIEDLKQTARGV